MPLREYDRRFLQTVDRLKILVLCLGLAVLIYLLATPITQLTAPTAVIGVALCMVFWVAQRLLTLITILDIELLKAIEVIRKVLPEDPAARSSGRRATPPTHRWPK